MDLALSSTNDLDLSVGGTPRLIDGTDAAAQQIRIRLRFFLGEWFLDQRLGIPYYQQILGHKSRPKLLEDAMRRAIVTTPGVARLLTLSTSFDGHTRAVSVSFRATLDTSVTLDFTHAFIV